MTVSVAMLAEQALRRLGVAIVPVADRPALTATIPAATIATNALTELGVIASDETPSPTDQALALAKVSAVHDAMTAQANVRWTVDAIPQAVSEEYARLAAMDAASSFGKQVDPQMLTVWEGRVRKVAMIMQAPDDAAAAVMSVHNDLVMRGIARWTSQDIPDALGDPYTVLAADALAPLYAMDTAPNDTQDAITAIYRYIALPSSGERTRAEYF
jgi:uncharacterized protein with GYD domain